MKNKQVRFIDLGLMDYKEAWDYQEELFTRVVNIKLANRDHNTEEPTPNYLIFCQHPHVFTLGKSGSMDHLLVNDDELNRKEATFYKINRGGDITYHGPGQLVAYPILDLDNFFTDIHRYVRFLEESVIRTCADYGITAGRIAGLTGVWLTDGMPRKICAIGVKSSRWVTMHGLAMNVNTDLSYFGNIVPCGIDDKAVTSLQQELGQEIPLAEVAEKLKKHLGDLFETEWI
ncbi:MAG: lipoyl(octanoyl) transferase LipB [Leadbetterella sp.]|nr:lipoyl(octanoyl) transferase LipB [Leadbetterella sp.]